MKKTAVQADLGPLVPAEMNTTVLAAAKQLLTEEEIMQAVREGREIARRMREEPEPVREEEFLVAVHEAGHCVMAANFNRGPVHSCLFLYAADPVVIGRTVSMTGLDEDEINRENIHERVMVALAGSLAEILYCGSSAGFDDDVNDAISNLRILSTLADVDDLREPMWECQQILADPTTWGKVLSVASVLYEQRELSGEEIREIIQACKKVEAPPIKPRRIRIAKKHDADTDESNTEVFDYNAERRKLRAAFDTIDEVIACSVERVRSGKAYERPQALSILRIIDQCITEYLGDTFNGCFGRYESGRESCDDDWCGYKLLCQLYREALRNHHLCILQQAKENPPTDV